MLQEKDKSTPEAGNLSLGNSPVQSEESKLWGLLRRKGIDQEYKLLHRIKDGRKDVYSIGRQKQCDIVISDQRVSLIHCLIYCDYLDERLTMFVSDCSTTGTFVNNSLTRLSSGERTELKSGDEIYLMSPTAESLVSFTFINMRERLFVPKVVDVAPLNHNHLLSDLNVNDSNGTIQRRIEDTYVIGNVIGHGMCGYVHVCTHKGTKKQYAVKVIDTKKFPKTPGLSASELRREADLMRNLNHPNIIQIKDSFETTHKLFIVMELVKGGDLFDRIIDKGKYSESEARGVMHMLLKAVKYLHSKGIVHRDLKPENILLVDNTPNSLIKISDFGLAKQASREGFKTFCGTPQYFAPEVLGQRQTSSESTTMTSNQQDLELNRGYNFKADMWSVGVVLYIMLSGVFPFAEETLFDQLREARYSVTGPQWDSISESAKDLVQSLMRLNPNDRYDVDQAMNHQWMEEMPSHTPPDVVINLPVALVGSPESSSTLNSIDNSDFLPPPVHHATSKQSKFNPVFWSLRRNMSATLTGDIISESNNSNLTQSSTQTEQSKMAQSRAGDKSSSSSTATTTTTMGSSSSSTTTATSTIPLSTSSSSSSGNIGVNVVDDIDEFSSDEDTKTFSNDLQSKKSRSRVKKSEKRVALTFSKEVNVGSSSKNNSTAKVNRKKGEILTMKSNSEQRKRTEPDGIMEQSRTKKTKCENQESLDDQPCQTSSSSSSSSSSSLPPLPVPSTSQTSTLASSSSSSGVSSTRSRRGGGLTITNMFI